MHSYVLDLRVIDHSQLALVGGKGANLGELTRLDGIHVPAGFCVTTEAFERVIAAVPQLDERVQRLSRLAPDDHDAIRTLSAELRDSIEAVAIPHDVAKEIIGALARLG